MTNLFDRQIKDTFDENLGDIHASEELKSKVLTRLMSESNVNTQKQTHLSAISPNFVIKHQTQEKKNIKVLVPVLIASALILIYSSVFRLYMHEEDDTIATTTTLSGNTSAEIARETAEATITRSNLPPQIRESQLSRRQGNSNRNSNNISYNSRAQ